MPDVAREAKRRKRTAGPPPHGVQTLARGPVPQKREGMPQILAPELPPRAPAPLLRRVQTPARGPEFLRHGLAWPTQTLEVLRRGVERQRLDPEFLRREAGRGQHRSQASPPRGRPAGSLTI